jgi:predicted outer membrane repeat protein
VSLNRKRALTALLMIGGLGVGSTGSASPVAAVSGDIVVGPAGCGDVGYVTDGVADNVQIQAAVDAAGDGDVVAICAGRYEYSDDVQWSEASADLVIRGAGAGATILDGNDAWNILAIYADNLRIEVRDITLLDGNAGWGSALLLFNSGAPSSAVLRDVRILSNDNQISVGAVAVENGTVEAYGSLFEGNRAPESGGAIYASEGIYVENSRFIDNEAGFNGGALYLNNNFSKVEIVRSTFTRNRAGVTGDGWGGVAYAYAIDARDSWFVGNQADHGGALAAYAGWLDGAPVGYAITRNIFRSNRAIEGSELYLWVYDETTLKGIQANRFVGASRNSAIYLANGEEGGPDSADGSLKLAARRLAAKNALGVRAIEIGN